MSETLPFFQDTRLVQNGGKDFLFNGKFYIELDGTSDPIYYAASHCGLTLTGATVFEYLKFFTSHLVAGGSAFHVLDSRFIVLNDKGKEYKISNPKLIKGTADFNIFANVLHGECFYKAWFTVSRGGVVEMVEDQPLGPVSDWRLR